MKYAFVATLAACLLVGCTHTIPVVTLESMIRNTALAAQRGAGGASDVVKIEVTVTNGYEVGGTVPIQIVPITAKRTHTDTTKLTLDIKLKDYKAPHEIKAAPSRYILNVKTGELTEVVEEPSPDAK